MNHLTDLTILKPARFGAIDLKNRVVMAPLTRSRADAMGVPAPFAAKYYAQRASAGLLITEATQVSFEGMGYCRTPGVHTPDQLAAWKSVTDAVHAKGGKILLQLWHVGRIANHQNRGVAADIVSASAITAPGKIYVDEKGMVNHDAPRALEASEIARVGADFAKAAANAIEAGFDGVEFHSANGYLAHQFLSSNVNQRSDRYGGSIANRIRMPLEVLEAITAAVPADRVGVRISPTHAFNTIEETDVTELYPAYLAELNRFGLAYLHVQRPYSNPTPPPFDVVAMARKHFSGPVLAAGGFVPDEAADLIGQSGADAVAFGRSFLANPDLPKRIETGAALNPPNEATFYTPGETGYTDYPALAA